MTTRIGLISDVHASPDALAEALHIFDRAGVDEVICAGDIAGYHDRLLPTIRLLQQANCKAVAGNQSCADVAVIPRGGVAYLSGQPASGGLAASAVSESLKELFKTLGQLELSPAHVVQLQVFLTAATSAHEVVEALELAPADGGLHLSEAQVEPGSHEAPFRATVVAKAPGEVGELFIVGQQRPSLTRGHHLAWVE